MARCPFCKDDVRQWDLKKKAHLIVTQSIDDHVHVHGNIHEKESMKTLVDAAIAHTKLDDEYGKKQVVNPTSLPPAEVVFHNRQRIGDILMFTAGVRDFKKAFPYTRVNVISTASHIWDNNPNIDESLVPTDANIVKIGPKELTNRSNMLDWHMSNAFRVSIERELGITFAQGPTKPDIWLTRDEWNAPPLFGTPYWLICIGGEPGWGCKMYPFEKWQEFVSQNPDTTFVQIGAQGDAHPKLQGANVIDHVGKTQDGQTGIRDLFKLFLNAEGSIGLVSFHMHLSAAFEKPCIVIDGAREPNHFTNYPFQQRLRSDGCLPCAERKACWACNIDTCKDIIEYPDSPYEKDRKVPRCVDIIDPDDLTKALNRYYRGGRLKHGVFSSRPQNFKNIVETAKIHHPPKKLAGPPKVSPVNIPFGGQEITESDWDFLEKELETYNVKTALEFGAGLFTLLMHKKGIKVTTYETDVKKANQIRQLEPSLDIRLWDGKALAYDPTDRYDLAFVDGPPGGGNREPSIQAAAQLSDLVIVHDAGREWETKWSDKHLKPTFKGPVKGGNRCHLWVKGEVKKPVQNKESMLIPDAWAPEETRIIQGYQPKGGGESKDYKPPQGGSAGCPVKSGKHIKFVSTARGWGGCARSCTTIMKYLLERDCRVEFIPFRNSVTSREYKECLNTFLRDVEITTDYSTIGDPCDVLFVYADDYIWEFDTPEMQTAFQRIHADRKIMMLNYRRGAVGEIPWTRDWDKYMFLNTTQEQELLQVHPGVKTKVLPPCTELEEFLKVKPDYTKGIKLVRHSSQGDTKYDKGSFPIEVQTMLSLRPDLTISLLPGPSFVELNDNRFRKWQRTGSPSVIASFLATGNLFWYSLPQGYMDMGPRVILEAMAAGLPILADNWGGAKDRVTPQTGWLCNTKTEHALVVQGVTERELESRGKAARERAVTEFIPERWIETLLQ